MTVFAVLRQRDFALLWTAGLISLTGNWMLYVALPLTVYELTGSAVATSGIFVAYRVPGVALGSVAGVFVDRWDRRRTMVAASMFQGVVLLPLLLVDSPSRVWLVYVVAFSVTVGGLFFLPAENAFLPRLVGDEHLVAANSLNALNNNLARLIGPPLGGGVVALAGLRGAALADAVSFGLAAAMIAGIAASGRPARAVARESPDVGSAWRRFWREWEQGLGVIRRHRLLSVVFGLEAVMSLGEGVFRVLIVVFTVEVLGGGAAELGWLMAGQAVGGLFGAALLASTRRVLSPARLLGWGAVGLGVIDLLIFNYPAFVPGFALGLALFVVVGVPATAIATGETTLLQSATDDAHRGRVFGALDTTAGLTFIVSTVVAGGLSERLGVVTVLNVQGIAYIVAGLAAIALLRGGTVVVGPPQAVRGAAPPAGGAS